MKLLLSAIVLIFSTSCTQECLHIQHDLSDCREITEDLIYKNQLCVGVAKGVLEEYSECMEKLGKYKEDI